MRDALKVYLPIIVLIVAGFVVAYRFVDPAPPSTLRMATGAPDGAYAAFGERYKAILARDRITLELVNTAGSVENLRLLKAEQGGVDIAFVQGGTASIESAQGLEALGSMFYEPLWVFVRSARAPQHLAELAGKRVAVGIDGSGIQAMARQLLAANGIAGPPTTLLPIGGNPAVQALLAGEVDAAFFVTARFTPQLEPLFDSAEVELMSFDRAEAYKYRFPYLSSLTLPAGVMRLNADEPPENATLLAPAAALVARDILHPALVDLLMAAATEIHGTRQLFAKSGEFPTREFLDLPLNEDAKRYLERGPSFLRRVLPFWAATLSERLLILLLPLITLMIPLMRLGPPAYTWQVRRKINRLYRRLRSIETRATAAGPEARAALAGELDALRAQVDKTSIPLSHAEYLYQLRQHIDQVEGRLKQSHG